MFFAMNHDKKTCIHFERKVQHFHWFIFECSAQGVPDEVWMCYSYEWHCVWSIERSLSNRRPISISYLSFALSFYFNRFQNSIHCLCFKAEIILKYFQLSWYFLEVRRYRIGFHFLVPKIYIRRNVKLANRNDVTLTVGYNVIPYEHLSSISTCASHSFIILELKHHFHIIFTSGCSIGTHFYPFEAKKLKLLNKYLLCSEF